MIHYFSQTGNTKLLGDFLKDNINDSKTIYVGFWTDKGNANQEALDYLKTLHHQKSFSLELLVLEKVKNILNVL